MPPRVEVRKTYKMYVGGEFVRSESGRSFTAGEDVNVPRGSRKDLRDAIKAARGAFGGWSRRTAMNRGQVLYRAAEMLDGRRSQFVELLGGGRGARREVERAIEAWVWYAGWTDKLAQVSGTVNPVAGPYFNFTLPEPTGVVGLVAPDRPEVLGLVQRMAPALCGGNTRGSRARTPAAHPGHPPPQAQQLLGGAAGLAPADLDRSPSTSRWACVTR